MNESTQQGAEAPKKEPEASSAFDGLVHASVRIEARTSIRVNPNDPGAVPFILTGVRQAVALGLIGVVVGEMFGGSEGIGFMVNYGGQTFQTDTVFLGVTIIALAGITLSWLAEQLEKRFSRWRPER